MPIHALLEAQYAVALARRNEPEDSKSYTAYLYRQGLNKILKKCGEEAFETVIAAKNSDEAETVGELNDLLYHMTVLLCWHGVAFEAVTEQLNRRTRTQGLEIDALFPIVAQRRAENAEGSYTAYLFQQGLDKILKKVGEACSLLLVAGKDGDPDALAQEAADLLYHLLVLMVCKEIPPEALAAELQRRSEKAGNLKTFHTTDLTT